MKTVEVPEAVVVDAGPELLDPTLAGGPKLTADVAVELPVAGAAEETDLRIEVLAYLRVAGSPAPERRAVGTAEAETVVAAGEARGLGLPHPAGEFGVVADPDLPVDRVRAVEVAVGRQGARTLAVDDEHARPAAVAVLAAYARDAEVVAVNLAEIVGLHVQEADVQAARLAGESDPTQDGDRLAAGEADPPAEEEFHPAAEGTPAADPELARVLQEEGPLFGEEEAETVEVDLLIVGLDLREVRVQGHIEREARGDAVLEVHAAVPFGAAIGDAVVASRGHGIRGQLEVALAGRDQTDQRAGLGHPVQTVLPGEVRPEGGLVLAPDVALEVDAPGAGPGVEAETAEGNRHLGAPPEVADAGPDGPGGVPVQVGARRGAAGERTTAAGPLVGHLAVILDATDVGAEHERVLPVAVGVEDEAKAVLVAERNVAPAV